jgi:hypothetical protein
MSFSWSLAVANLTSVAVLVFALGALAARFGADVRLPDAAYQFVSVYLLLGIGLKGGHALNGVSVSEIAAPVAVTLAMGVLIPLVAFATLRLVRRLDEVDRGAIAAHYGSTSLVTFTAALTYLESTKVSFEGYATTLLTLLEIPGIVIGIYLGARHLSGGVPWGTTLRETITGKTVLLLVGGLIAGAVTSEAGYAKVAPFFVELQAGFLALFLLHLGANTGFQWPQIRAVGAPLAAFAVLFPVVAGTAGVVAGHFAGLSVGGATLLGVLCASASYIAAPASVAIGLPSANGALAMSASIGVTFPFNLAIGIPLYLEVARILGG